MDSSTPKKDQQAGQQSSNRTTEPSQPTDSKAKGPREATPVTESDAPEENNHSQAEEDSNSPVGTVAQTGKERK